MGSSRQKYWSGLPCPPPGDLPDPGIEPMFAALAGGFFLLAPPGEKPFSSHISFQFPILTLLPHLSVIRFISFSLVCLRGAVHCHLSHCILTPSHSLLFTWLCFRLYYWHLGTLISLPHPTYHQTWILRNGSELAITELLKWFQF